MRIAVDCDGVLCEGPSLSGPLTAEMFKDMQPYDADMPAVLRTLAKRHEVYIITSRSFPHANDSVWDWLRGHAPGATQFLQGVISSVEPTMKYGLAHLMKVDLFFDDHPRVLESSEVWLKPRPEVYMMNNPHFPTNQEILTSRRVRSWKEIEEIVRASERT